MLILGFVLVSALIGCLLYLPFFLWFRRRRRLGIGLHARSVNLTTWGKAFSAVQIFAMLAGFAAATTATHSVLGRLAGGPAGPWRWFLMVMITFNVAAMVARRVGVVLDRTEPIPAGTPLHVPRAREPRWRLRARTRAGVSITVHPSFAITGVAIALVAASGAEESFGCWIACLAIYALHEIGHAMAARRRGLKVFSIDLSMSGGACRTQLTRSVGDTGWVFAAGLLVQLALMGGTLLATAVTGIPQTPLLHGLFLGFTVANAVIMAINLIPGHTEQGLKTDGAVLWELWRHARAGAPHPLAQLHAATPMFARETCLLDVAGMVPPGFVAGVEILNDDATPMEFVVEMLHQHVGLMREAAVDRALAIHLKGGVLLPIADAGRARAVASAISQATRAAGHPLVCRAVEIGATATPATRDETARSLSPPPPPAARSSA